MIAVALAWGASIAAAVTGTGTRFHHDQLIEGGRLPLLVAVLVFLAAWQAMVAAMMLPSSLPMIRLFDRVSAGQPDPIASRAAFLGGYAIVWTLFGAVAFIGDVGIHHLVDSTSWLQTRPWLVSGALLGVAGVAQFTPLTTRCLHECRHPVAYLLHRYRPGVANALRLGLDHGKFCLGCCWGLMLVMFGAGVASVTWMAGLTALMVYQKVGRRGARAATVTGWALLCWSVLVVAHPGWLPHPLAGVEG